MPELKQLVKERIEYLKQIIRYTEQQLKNVPEGSIWISRSNKRIQYYLNKNGTRKYLTEEELPLVQPLCQKDYDEKVLKAAQKELKELEKLYNDYDSKNCDNIYQNLNSIRQNQVKPIRLSDQQFIQQWEQVKYQPKGFQDKYPEYYTDKGERVRSKTEILIANALLKHNIPYRYEYPIKLPPYGTIHPDFTILNVRKRKEYIWEHMGLLDDEDYRERALEKINTYAKNEIFPGDKLILTYETQRNPINSQIIEKTIQKFLI